MFYNLETDSITIQLGNLTWPDNSFLPRAVDISQNSLIVVLGYVGSNNSKYTPCAYLLSRSGANFTVFDTWLYTPPSNSSWQASLTNWDAYIYSAKYDMSVSFNDAEDQVLLGIQVVNTLISFYINATSKKFVLPSQSLSNGKAIGMGKAVGWINDVTAIVLVNTYSMNYVWSASQIFTYNLSTNNFVTKSIIPNAQQTLSSEFGPIVLSFVVTDGGIVIMLDSIGSIYILLPSPPGTYADTSAKSISSFLPCIAGSFSSQFDIQPCWLCPQGYTTNGSAGQLSCVSCTSGAFCPLGSAFGNIQSSSPLFTNINQVRAYPLSPQSIRFDNILMQNVFVIDRAPGNRCLVRSPFFWTLIIILLGIIIATFIIILQYCVAHPRGKRTNEKLKKFFRQTDMVGEGELWMGGIVSFAIIFLCICGYVFSGSYYQSYPIETASGMVAFACGESLTNAQFDSGLMSLVVLPNEDEVRIFELLNAQRLTLHVDLINTLYECSDLTLTQIKGIKLPLTYSSCEDGNGTLSISIPLPSQGINLQLLLGGINTIGGIRLALEGSGTEEENESLEASYKLLDLSFAQTFSYAGRVLIEEPSFNIQLTKIINRTYPLSDPGIKTLSALWLPYVSVDVGQIFATENEYIYATSTDTTISLVISETSFYVLNTQKPIADEAELIFTDLLFTITCIEIFGLIFLMFKLLIVPIMKYLLKCRRRPLAEKPLTSIVDESPMLSYKF